MQKLKIVVFVVMMIPSFAFSHGEDKPGPHNGQIQMPGNFHTEVVEEKEGFRIYLLDIEWKNPTVQNSKITAQTKVGTKTTELTCTTEKESFFCKTKKLRKGKLRLLTVRDGQNGIMVDYKLPLKQSKNSVDNKNNPHGMHH